MRWPLRRQIMLPLLAVAVLGLIGLGALNAVLAAKHARQRIERQLRGVVDVLAASNFPLTDAVLRQMRRLSNAELVIVDEQGRSLATSLASLRHLPAGWAPRSSGGDLSLGDPLEIDGVHYFYTATSLPRRPGPAAPATLHLLFPVVEYRRSWREAFLPPLTVGAAMVAALIVVAHIIASRLSAATSRLGDEMLRLARGNYTPAELPSTDDELRDLSLAINRTAEMLGEYEQQVRQTEQMRTISLLGAGLAHEMRNAATGCRMALDLHAESCETGDTESLSVAKRQLRLMESQLQRLLRAARPAEGRSPREFDFRQLVEELLPLVQPAAKHAGVELSWQSSPVPAVVNADHEALGQVVLNLLINAIEAAQHPSGASPKRVHVQLASPTSDRVAFSVCDSGPGPCHLSAEQVFDPFTSTKPEGIGLGLAVARKVVEAHRGSIRWTRLGAETRFSVDIPLAAKGNDRV